MKKDMEKLRMWQDRLETNNTAYSAERIKMDAREQQYIGTRKLRSMVRGERTTETRHVRNISAELIEAQVDSNIPMPKVTPLRPGDERKAKLIEDMLRNEMDRLPMEQINDMMERTVPIQGGAAFLLEWDETQRTHTTRGELAVTAIHPKQLVPQDGVYSGIEDMDYIILKVPETKAYIKARYGVNVEKLSEEEPEIKGVVDDTAEDLITMYRAYYRNENGGIGIFAWACDTVLEDIDDYQARRRRHCVQCGAPEPVDSEPMSDGERTETNALLVDGGGMGAAVITMDTEDRPRRSGRRVCPYCGGTKWEESAEDFEEVRIPITRSDGSVIPGETLAVIETVNEDGSVTQTVTAEPTRIPFYKPDIYPVILQKNVSVYGKFLGDSDLDKIADQQNTVNRIESKIIDKLLASGSYITLPDDASIKVDTDDAKVIRPGNAANKALIDVYDLQGNIAPDMSYLAQVYEEARQIIGVTDSFQGRHDPTATSGKAKEFAAAQSAGRLESKRVMKHAAYAQLFEAMFKFKLSCDDDQRSVVSKDINGNDVYEVFNRYDFLEKDAAGEWYWNDRFLFSCDATAPLASNREAMWQETRLNLQTGAFGDPTNPQTLILFWGKMDALHYPGAKETKAYLEQQLQHQQEAMRRQEAVRQQAARQSAPQQSVDDETARAVVERARQDAAAEAQRRFGNPAQ